MSESNEGILQFSSKTLGKVEGIHMIYTTGKWMVHGPRLTPIGNSSVTGLKDLREAELVS